MSAKKIKLSKKTAHTQIIKTLESSLGDLHQALGEKKFKRRIKKASKLLTSGLPKTKKEKKMKSRNIILDEVNPVSENGTETSQKVILPPESYD